MKAKKMVAVLAGAVLATGMVAGLSACSKDDDGAPKSLGTTTLNIADYATEYRQNYYTAEGYKSIQTIKTLTNLRSTVSCLAVYENSNSTYNVYNLALGKDVLTNLAEMPTIKAVSCYSVSGYSSGSIYVIEVAEEDEYNQVQKTYYMPDGSVILSKYSYSRINAVRFNAYINNDREKSEILYIAGQFQASDSYQTFSSKYYKVVTDENTGEETFVELSSSESYSLKFYGSDYDYNSVYGCLPLWEGENTVDGEMGAISYKEAGDTLVFYSNGNNIASVDLHEKYALGFVDNYLYYCSYDIVESSATSGYNFVYAEGDSTYKYNYHLYRFDIIENEITELNYDVVIYNLQSIYNYTEKSYDALCVSGYKMVDGVAFANMKEFTYITDKDLNVAYDVSSYGFNSVPEIYSLGDGLYLAGNVVLDEDLNIVNTLNSTNYVGAGLDSFLVNYNGRYYYGFTDLKGNVVYEPKYLPGEGTFEFYDGIAYVSAYSINNITSGESNYLFIKNDGSMVNCSTILATNSFNETKSIEVNEGYYIVTTTKYNPDTSAITSKTLSFYTFGGALLKTFETATVNDVSVRLTYNNLPDGSLLIREQKTDMSGNVPAYSYTYYKLVK